MCKLAILCFVAYLYPYLHFYVPSSAKSGLLETLKAIFEMMLAAPFSDFGVYLCRYFCSNP